MYEAALRQGDASAAALTMQTLGDVYRLQDEWEEAIERYRAAEEQATAAGATRVHYDALVGRARALMLGLQRYDEARAAALEASQIAERALGSAERFNALDLRAQVEISSSQYETALALLNQALATPDVDDEDLFYGLLDRADAYTRMVYDCDPKTDIDGCIAAADMASRDYRRSLDIARSLGWSGLAERVESLQAALSLQRQLLEQQAPEASD